MKIYTTNYCGYCRSAKFLLERKGVAFDEIDCSRDPALRDWLVETTGLRTVPQIFLGNVPIGGYDELAELEGEGALDDILEGRAVAPSVL